MKNSIKNKNICFSLLFVITASLFHCCLSVPDEGKWDIIPSQGNQSVFVLKSLFKGSGIFVHLTCDPKKHELDVTVSWLLAESPCWEDFLHFKDANQAGEAPLLEEEIESLVQHRNWSYKKVKPKKFKCQGRIVLDPYQEPVKNVNVTKDDSGNLKHGPASAARLGTALTASNVDGIPRRDDEIFTVQNDGIYFLFVTLQEATEERFVVHMQMRGLHGYLSAADWPLLPFYGVMCLLYVVYGLAWLIISFCQWRELLRIQFWIGGVILLGMLEKAMFYAEYQSINSAGTSVRGAVLFAELVSCGKRTLARMLVIIVSLGFGIVKPRLGPMLHRVIGVGLLYFCLAEVESYLRVMRYKSGFYKHTLIASVPLAVLDSAICWWIFSSLVQTTRTLRLRRNVVKLTLYKHFTNTLIFSVITSAFFMFYSIKAHRITKCLTDWKDLWIDEAFWHLLFSVLLLVIMVLWRPTINNQRYAFSPLLDATDDEDELMAHDEFGPKMRLYRSKPRPGKTNDDLTWVEENIPSSLAETSLPVLDSDEEIVTTKFEMSKMQ